MLATSLDTDDLHLFIIEEGTEHANGVRATSNTSHDDVWQASRACHKSWVACFAILLVQHLSTSFITNNRLKITYDVWERVWPHSATDNVVRGSNIRHPIA